MDFRVDTNTWFVFSILFTGTFALFIVAFIAIPYFSRNWQIERVRNKISRKSGLYKQLEEKYSKQELKELEKRNQSLEANLNEVLWDFLKPNSNPLEFHTFFPEFEKVYPDFNHFLLSLYPGITEYELKLCCLIRMKLTAKEISRLMNITPASVNKARYRLRKKMNLDQGESLDRFILEI
jgi:hypothetical protein